MRGLPRQTPPLLEATTPNPHPAMNDTWNPKQGRVAARAVSPDLITDNPLLAFVASLVACLQHDLVTGIQRGWIDPNGWRMLKGEEDLLCVKASLRETTVGGWKKRDQRHHRLNRLIEDMSATSCAVAALHDGRLERMMVLMNACANGRVDFSPDLIKRRAIAMAANPLAFCAGKAVSNRRAIEHAQRLHSETL